MHHVISVFECTHQYTYPPSSFTWSAGRAGDDQRVARAEWVV